jgi:hypothetical protein
MDRSDCQKCVKAGRNARPLDHQTTVFLLKPGKCLLGLEPWDNFFDRSTTVFLALPDPLRELRPNTPLFRLSRLRRDNQSYAASPYLVAALGQATMMVMPLSQIAVATFDGR